MSESLAMLTLRTLAPSTVLFLTHTSWLVMATYSLSLFLDVLTPNRLKIAANT